MLQFRAAEGSVLVVTMVVLLLLQLIVAATLSSVNISSQVLLHNERVTAVGRDGDNLLNYLIGYFIKHSRYLDADSNFDIPIPDYIVAQPRRASITQFTCLDCPAVEPSTGQTLELSNLDQTTWQLEIESSDAQTGVVTELIQGLRIIAITDNSTTDPASAITGLRLQQLWWYSQQSADIDFDVWRDQS